MKKMPNKLPASDIIKYVSDNWYPGMTPAEAAKMVNQYWPGRYKSLQSAQVEAGKALNICIARKRYQPNMETNNESWTMSVDRRLDRIENNLEVQGMIFSIIDRRHKRKSISSRIKTAWNKAISKLIINH